GIGVGRAASIFLDPPHHTTRGAAPQTADPVFPARSCPRFSPHRKAMVQSRTVSGKDMTRSESHLWSGNILMIDLAWLSLAALVLVIVLSCTTTVNPGFLSLALAWLIGIYLAPLWGRELTMGQLVSGFPTDLFLTLVGVTLLFSLAKGNGTLDRVVRAA